MYLAEVEGKGGINAKLVAYSVSPEGNKIATFELTYHRYIHGEFMTHRLFSRNAMSSRAVPVSKMLETIREAPAMPIHWGKNQPGMQAKEEHDAVISLCGVDWTREGWWLEARNEAIASAQEFSDAGYHKQIVNRLVEPFQMMKTVMTATEMDNFFWLRLDADAQPEIFELARCMRECLEKSEPELLYPGEWHTPYVQHVLYAEDYVGSMGRFAYVTDGPTTETSASSLILTEEDALAISSSCCAQVSYRNLDNTYDKAMAIYGRLLTGAKVHASPFEHQGTPMVKRDLSGMKSERGVVNFQPFPDSWEKGITHVDREGNFWSANFCGFIQHRQLLDNHNCVNYVPE